MDTHWAELQILGIEVEENELSMDEFELLLRDWLEEHQAGAWYQLQSTDIHIDSLFIFLSVYELIIQASTMPEVRRYYLLNNIQYYTNVLFYMICYLN